MAARSILFRGRRSLLTVLAVSGLFALVPTAALAFWSTHGGGVGNATTANLSAPTSATASATSSGDVTVAWTAPATKPTGSTVAYRVFRSGSTTAVCGTATSATTQTSCTDAAPPSGTYTYTVQAVLNSWTATSATSNSVTVGTATKLVFSSDPVTGAASQTANLGPITVALRDANNRAAVASAAVSVSLSSSSRRSIFAATQNGTAATSVSIPAGSSSVDFYYGDQKSGSPTLTASSTGLTSATRDVTVTAASASKLVWSAQPANAVAGATLADGATGSPSAQVQDTFGNVVTNSAASVTVALPTGTTATLAGTKTVTAVNGVATFGGLSIAKAGSYTLSAAATGLTGATSGQFTISPAAAAQLVWSTQPPNGAKGAALSPAPVVQIQDQYGNLTTSTASVTVAVASGPSGGQISSGSTTSVTAVNGVATFSGVSLSKAGSYTLNATSPGLTQATSASFTIT